MLIKQLKTHKTNQESALFVPLHEGNLGEPLVFFTNSFCRLKTDGCLRLGDVTTLNLTHLKVAYLVCVVQKSKE